jgi:hypothetical protein
MLMADPARMAVVVKGWPRRRPVGRLRWFSGRFWAALGAWPWVVVSLRVVQQYERGLVFRFAGARPRAGAGADHDQSRSPTGRAR